MSFSVHFNPAQASLKSLCLSSINLIACIPVTASILLIPAATPVSATILNNPISPTFETWVPPQSSFENSPAATTLTLSPYFSSNKAVAPLCLASSIVIRLVSTFATSMIFSFTKSSTFWSSSELKAWKWVKSNLNLSLSTYEPDWWTCEPTISFKAACNICVAVWFLAIKLLLCFSTNKLTSSLALKLPSLTST